MLILIHLESMIKQTSILMRHVKIFLLTEEDDPLGNQNMNKKCHLEERAKELDLMEEDVERLYQRLSEKYQLPKERHSNMFEIRNGELYYKGVDKPLTYNRGKIKTVGKIYKILGENRLHVLGFDISKGKPIPQQSVILNKADEEMPSTSDLANVDDIEFQEITGNVQEAWRISLCNSRENPLRIYPCMNS